MTLKLSQFRMRKKDKYFLNSQSFQDFFFKNQLIFIYSLIYLFIYSLIQIFTECLLYVRHQQMLLFCTHGLFLIYMIFKESQVFVWENKNVVFLSKEIKQIIQRKLWHLTIAIETCDALSEWLPILPSPQSLPRFVMCRIYIPSP